MKTAKDDEPKTYDPQGLRDAAENLREFLMEIEAFAVRMEERKIATITVTSGSKAYNRAKDELDRWSRGVRDGLYAAIGTARNEGNVSKSRVRSVEDGLDEAAQKRRSRGFSPKEKSPAKSSRSSDDKEGR